MGSLSAPTTASATPHVYELGVGVAPGKHTLTIRVDNRVIVEVGDWSHSVSDHTQGNWNGVVGRIELGVTEPVWIEDLQVYPHVATKSVTVKGRVGRVAGQPSTDTVALCLLDRFDARPRIPTTKAAVHWSDQGGTFEAQLALPGDAVTWDEFQPRLYELTVWADTSLERPSSRQVLFGLREITTRGREFLLNGHPAFFRGTLECCIFPKTGYPPTDVESWRRIIRICKDHGLNHIRFHSWCPPEAAFRAADELGFYYQVECGVWTQPGDGKPIDQWIYRESERIVRAYGNHPSFLLLTHGNEPHGPKHQEYLAKWVSFWKSDGRFLVTSGSAYPQLPENQYHVYHPCRGPHGWLGKDYRSDVAKLDVPVIVHEMGQWCVYPNFDEVKKYTGPLKPKNFDIFRDSLAEHGMLDQARDFVRASGKLQVLCYKEEVEAALRTPGIGGVQLLDLHDFPGQGTALVGVLDPFWDSKGYITAQEFRRFYGPTVPLARLLKRTWTTDEVLTCDVEVAHFGPAPLESAVGIWRLLTDSGEAVAAGEFASQSLPLGSGTALGKIRVDLSTLAAPKAYRLVVGLKDTPAENDWNLWVYPAQREPAEIGDVLVTTTLDEKTLARLECRRQGIACWRTACRPSIRGSTSNRSSGIAICSTRRASKRWACSAIRSTRPWRCSRPSPGRTGNGTTLSPPPAPWCWRICRRACAPSCSRLTTGTRTAGSDSSSSAVWARDACSCAPPTWRRTIVPRRASSGPACWPMWRATASSRRSRLRKRPWPKCSNAPSRRSWSASARGCSKPTAKTPPTATWRRNAIDGDPDTFWHTRWTPRNDPMPHHLVIDLGREMAIKGITCLPRQDMANGRIAEAEVFVSNDPKSWGTPVAQAKWRDTGELQTVAFPQPVRARYLKLVVKSEVNRNAFAAVAELDVLLDERK